MPRYDDRHGSTRLYVGHLSSRTRSRDLEDLFSRYGRFLGFCPTWRSMVRMPLVELLAVIGDLGDSFCNVIACFYRNGNNAKVRDVDLKRDFAFIEFSDPRDADDARYSLNGRDFDGSRIVVEFAKGGPRGSRDGGSRDGGSREYLGRGAPPGSGRCFNCGIDGHWARDCKAGDWKNKCYRCGERGHIERNCQNSPKSLKRGRSYSGSLSKSPVRRGRSRSRSYSRGRSYSRSKSPPRRERNVERERSRSAEYSRSPKPKRSPPPAKGRNRSPSPEEDSPPLKERRQVAERNGSDYSGSPRGNGRSPSAERDSPVDRKYRSPEANGSSPSPRDNRSPVEYDDEDNHGSPRGSRSPSGTQD
ncbi:hypothetical protein AAC387_Pa05g3719 [Persea americana]